MLKTISCRAAYGKNGQGRHFAQVVDEAQAAGELKQYYTTGIRPGDEQFGRVIDGRRTQFLLKYTPIRFSRGWPTFLVNDLFDRAVARHLKDFNAGYAGFVGGALHGFRRARELGTLRLELHAPTCHVHVTARQNAKAHRDFKIERGWLNPVTIGKALKEYEMADVIYVNSSYTLESFIDEGIPAEKLHRFQLRPHPRFTPPASRPKDGIFRVLYVGSLSVTKGIPVLLEAFSRLAGSDAELILVGGCSTRAMANYLASWEAKDPRIRREGYKDPLPFLHQADVYVHPSYQEGFGYAPMEALTSGLPVIVTEDTGMKEHVLSPEQGYIVRTGSWQAILEPLEAIYQNH